MPKKTSGQTNFIAVLGMSQILYYVSSVFYLPTLTDVADSLDANVTRVQFSVTCLLFGQASATFLSGYLSDVLSRKKLLIAVPPCYMLGTLLCALTDNIYVFLVGVFFFGFSAGGASINAQTLSHDLSPKNPSTIIGFSSSISNLFSAIALVTAGYFAHQGHWRGIYYVMFIYSLILWVVSFFFKDTPIAKRKKVKLSKIFKNYYELIKESKFLIFALPYSLANSGIFIFYTISPFLLIKDLHISQKEYGFLMLIPVFAGVIGRSTLGFLSKFLSTDILLLIGETLIFLGALLILIFVDFFQISALEVIGPMGLYMMGYGILSPTIKSDVMVLYNIIAGTAVALTALTSNLVSATSSYFVSHYLSEYLGTCLLTISIIVFIAHYIGYRYRQKHNIKI